MTRNFIAIMIIAFTLGCSDQKIQLPMLPVEGVGEIHNHSGIWIFFEVKGTDTLAVMNKNNKLQNTHWIFHIDKRLDMAALAPLLNEMQVDHDKESMHKKEGMLNYFSFADSLNQRMSLLHFDRTVFTEVDPEELPAKVQDSCIAFIEIREEGLWVNGQQTDAREFTEASVKVSKCGDSTNVKTQLVYGHDLSYQSYLSAKAKLLSAGIVSEQEEWMIRKK